MKRTALLLSVAFAVAGCSTPTPVMKIDDLWAEREKSKSEFHKKYAGKEIVVAGVYKGALDFKGEKKDIEEITIQGSSLAMIHCQVEEKDAAPFKAIAGKGGGGVAIKGKLVSGENDPYPELKPCSMAPSN